MRLFYFFSIFSTNIIAATQLYLQGVFIVL